MFRQLFLVAIFLKSVYSKNILVDQEQFAVIFDAGSKGTRMYIYKYQLEPVNILGRIKLKVQDSIEQKFYCELNDNGLGSYTSVDQIEPYFSNCMQKANELIPIEKRSQTYISLLATAGVRLLQIRDKDFAESLFHHLRLYFAQSEYYFKDPSQVKVISGQEEGLLSFLSANYFDSTLSQSPRGILDIGGASAQIAFVPQTINYNIDVNLNEYIYDAQLSNNQNYKIYTHSSLCFGTNQILSMYNVKTIRDNNYDDGTSSLLASCYPEGSSVQITGDEILNNPCVNGLMFDQNQDFTIDKNRIQREQVFTINGNSKKNKCREEIDRLIPQPECPFGSNQCSFNGVYMPTISSESQFYALGNYFEAFDLTSKLLNVDLNNNLQAFNESTYLICSMSYTKLRKLNTDNNADIGKKRLAKLCLENSYILRLFELYGIKDLKNVDAVEYVNGKKVGWILGYLINQLEQK